MGGQFGGDPEDHYDLENSRNPNGNNDEAVQHVRLELRVES